MSAKIKKGDRVVVLAGRDKGRQGQVLRVLPKEDRLFVGGINMVQRHTRPSQGDPQGGIKPKAMPVHVSNVAIVDSTGKVSEAFTDYPSDVPEIVRQLAADCYEMNKTEIGLFYGTCSGVGGMIGTIYGGYLADKLGAKDRRWFLWVPMWGKLIGGPLFIACLLAPTAELALMFYFFAITMAAMYLGPSLAITHHLVSPSMRAMSSAVLFFLLNIIGLGFGPMIVGMISDWLTANTDIVADSARWGMIIAVCATYPLCILWHLGARHLPQADQDGEL